MGDLRARTVCVRDEQQRRRRTVPYRERYHEVNIGTGCGLLHERRDTIELEQGSYGATGLRSSRGMVADVHAQLDACFEVTWGEYMGHLVFS